MESLVDFVGKYAANGNEVAIRHRRGHRMETWSYAQIVQGANRLARELEFRGIGKGDVVLLWGENSPEWIVVFFGCLLRGAVIVPVDHGSTVEFVSRIGREVNAKLLFRARTLPDPELPIQAVVLESVPELTASRDVASYPASSFSRSDTLEIIFTSGTTSEPRGVVISHGNVLANIEPLEREIQKYLRYERIFHPLRFLNLLPLSHVFGQMLGIFIPPFLAGTVVFIDSLKPSEIVDVIRRERISVLVAVPRFIESLQREIQNKVERDGLTRRFNEDFARGEKEHFLRRWWRFRRIRSRFGWKFWAFISGGAALPEQVEAFWMRLGYAAIQGYGMTETTSLISLNHPFHTAQGSIGKVFPGVEVRVGEQGEILVRGENVAKAYRRQDGVQPVVETDGWFRTGDLAETGEDGNLYFKGRKKNVIVTPAGMNIYPEDLEKAVRREPGVRDCVVIGLERDGNAEPCAVLLMAAAGSNPESAVQSANRSLAEYQQVRNWFVWPDPDFPRTPTLKPLLPRIREVVNAKIGAASLSQDGDSTLAALITQITGRPVSPGSRKAGLEADLKLTSLDRVELMSALEDRYQTELNDVQFSESGSIAQLEKLLTETRAASVEHVYPRWPQRKLVTAIRLVVYYLLAWPATYFLAAPRVRGRENLRGVHGPVLVISNHVTYVDIAWILPALPARFRNRLATAMGGERLARMRRPPKEMNLFGRLHERLDYFLALSLFNVFPLPQQSGFLKSFSFTGDLADRGWNILVFPEGQTTVDGNMLAFQSGIGLLAKRLNIPVVPVRLTGLYDLKQQNRILARPGHVKVVIGQPVCFPPDQDANEIARELERRVKEL
ncbi:MAG TPA: AMP-binding protein [Methylomirabilota bacterium]|nr:AMP-binding protein [Methylomirabilota bacterium]